MKLQYDRFITGLEIRTTGFPALGGAGLSKIMMAAAPVLSVPGTVLSYVLSCYLPYIDTENFQPPEVNC